MTDYEIAYFRNGKVVAEHDDLRRHPITQPRLAVTTAASALMRGSYAPEIGDTAVIHWQNPGGQVEKAVCFYVPAPLSAARYERKGVWAYDKTGSLIWKETRA